MARFHFYLRDKTSDSRTTIQLHVRWDSQRLKFNTGIRVKPNDWNDSKQIIKQSRSVPNYLQHNEFLQIIIVEAEKEYHNLIKKIRREPTSSELKQIVQPIIKGKSVSQSLLPFIQSHCRQMEEGRNPRTGSKYSKETIKTYRLCFNKLIEFQNQTNYQIDFDSINLEFHKKFLDFLINHNCKPNYQGKLIKMIKTFMNEALEQGLTQNKQHLNRKFYAPKEDTIQVYLDDAELLSIRKIELTQERLNNARDLFLIGCYTGLRFSDFIRITNDSFVTDDKGNRFLQIKLQKSKKNIGIPILPELEIILKQRNGVLPRSISNQKLNLYIKEICKKVDLLNKEIILNKDNKFKYKWEMIGSHTARRSFATNAVKMGLSTRLIMNITGHTTESAFYRYIRLSTTENAILFQQQYSAAKSSKMLTI